ncbi:MAG TPA: hypothetical protein VNW97_03900 [Candidatus Saccharimonadales bacterium]|nr:hypothetical protein [Candidatus Saccharimonadales bacterium]
MRTCSLIFPLALLLSFGAAAQTVSDSSPNAATAAVAPTVPGIGASAVPVIGGGTGVVAELSKTVNAKKAKAGDRVRAEVIQDVLYRGKIVMRTGSKLVGHVTLAKAHTKEDSESRLSIVFDKVELKGGGELNLLACIRALAAPSSLSLVDKPDLMGPPPSSALPGQNGPQPLGTSRSGNTQSRGSPSPNQSIPRVSAGDAYNHNAVPAGPLLKSKGTLLLSSVSRGVYGLHGLSLAASGTGVGQSTVILAMGDDVKLESGVQIVVQLNAPVTQ